MKENLMINEEKINLDIMLKKIEENLWKTLKSMGLSAKTSSDSKICLKDGENLSLDSKNNVNA